MAEVDVTTTKEAAAGHDDPSQEWDTDRYQSQHSFVYEFGASLIDLLDPKEGETVLDLGCGTGELASAISERGANVIGIDADPRMIEKASAQFPSIDFNVADARSFTLDDEVDAVFSNAALHWVLEAERAVEAVSKALKPGGRFVAEFGGRGNVATISSFLDRATGPDRNPWYFPSVAQYSSLLERHGIEVTFATLYHRSTPLNEGTDGLRNWILMFGNTFLEGLSEERREAVLTEAETVLRPSLFDGEQWSADYRRIRIVGVKEKGHNTLSCEPVEERCTTSPKN